MRSVRMEAARLLIDLPPEQMSGGLLADWERALESLLASERFNADRPEVAASVHHYVKIRTQGNTLLGEAIDINGNLVDSFAIFNQ